MIRMKEALLRGLLTGNQLKMVAVVAMTCDHVGKQILTDIESLQLFGRIAFPIFAYMIAEGCRYTKNRKKYLGTMAVIAFVCQLVYFVAMRSVYQCVLVTFSLSVALIYAIDYAARKRDIKSGFIAISVLVVVYILTEMLPKVLTNTDFMIDYGLCGVMLPVFVYMASNKINKLIIAAFTLVLLSAAWGGIQWYCLWAIPLLALYNGEKGKARIKNLFYIYYPLHLAVIYVVSEAIR